MSSGLRNCPVPPSPPDPDVPFVPSLVPFGNHILYEHEDMEIQCRVSDPSANVTLVNMETQQPVASVYDSKRGAVGVFTAGTYVCKALVNGEEHHSGEYIVHGWPGESRFLPQIHALFSPPLPPVRHTRGAHAARCLSGGAPLHVELSAERTALLVGDAVTVTCVARGSEILEDHWKYPGKLVRTHGRRVGRV